MLSNDYKRVIPSLAANAFRSLRGFDPNTVTAERAIQAETPPAGGDAAHSSLFAQVRPNTRDVRSRIASVTETASWIHPLSEAARKKQHDDDDQDDPNETVAAVTIAVAWTAETATEATKQEDDEDYDEDGYERHDESPFAAISEC